MLNSSSAALLAFTSAVLLTLSAPAFAQTPPAPPPPPAPAAPDTSTGLYIRGESEGDLTTDRLAFDARVDRKLSTRTSLYGAVQYLSDEFKQIDYLVSPTVGIAHQLVKNDRTEFAVDTGIGLVWEKNPGFDVDMDGALTAGQNFKHKLTATAELTSAPRRCGRWTTSTTGSTSSASAWRRTSPRGPS